LIYELIDVFPSFLYTEVNKSIFLQKDEVLVGGKGGCIDAQAFGVRFEAKGFIAVTNQRVLFAGQTDFFDLSHAVTYGINLEDIMSVSHAKLGRSDKLVIVDKWRQMREFVRPDIQSVIPAINKAISERKSEAQTQKVIVLDFTSLKDTMVKGGIIMSTYNCPTCNASLEIPEAGKVMVCKYCGTPIKPVDIFERIKTLL